MPLLPASIALLLAATLGQTENPNQSSPDRPERPELVRAEVRAQIEPPAIEWIRANATTFVGDVPSQTELAPLVKALQGARVVGLGEATHGDHQSQVFKNHAIRELVRQGRIDSLMVEVNRQAGADLDAYINQGKGDFTTLMLDSGIFSIWRTDDFANLILWLRAYVLRTGKPFRVYGVDCQDASSDIQFALTFIESRDPAARRQFAALDSLAAAHTVPSQGFYNWIDAQNSESHKTTYEATQALLDFLNTKKQAWSADPVYAEALYAVRTARQALQVYELEASGKEIDFSTVPLAYWARRDRYMAENLLERLGEGRAALWAHDTHVAGGFPAFLAESGFLTLGSEVRKTLGTAYVSVGFAWTVGRVHARRLKPSEPLSETAKSPFEPMALSCERPGDLGEVLARVGPDRFYIDLRQADPPTKTWAETIYYRGWAGAAANPEIWLTDPSEAAPLLPIHDILVYTKTLTPSTTYALPTKQTILLNAVEW